MTSISSPPSESFISAADLRKFRIAFSLREIEEIKSVAFTYGGSRALFNTEAEIKVLTLSDESVSSECIKVEKYGASIAKFMRNKDIVHTSTRDNTMRVLDSQGKEKKYKTYLPGHSKEVTSFSVSRLDDFSLVSGAQDCSVRVWDTRTVKHQQMATYDAPPFVAFHPFKQTIAVAHKDIKGGSGYVLELARMDLMPTARFEIEDCGFDWCGMRFSSDGRLLMVNTNESLIMIIDVKTGEVVNRLRGLDNPNRVAFHSCFSPDSKFVIGGSEDGLINVWNLDGSQKEFMLKSATTSENVEVFRHVEFSPGYMCFATIGNVGADQWSFNLWIEDDGSDEKSPEN